MKRLTAIFLSLIMLISLLAGCEGEKVISPTDKESQTQISEKSTVKNLTENIEPQNLNGKRQDEKFVFAMADFSFDLFKALMSEKENTLVSPLSIINCLALVQNGANGNTLNQFESTFEIKRNDMNLYLKSYNAGLNTTKSVKQANSIWFDSVRFTPKPQFLQNSADYFNADILSADFNSPNTIENINAWTKKNTDNMIDNIIDDIDADAVMYLINALTFSADWAEPYNDYQVSDGTFCSQISKNQKADYLNCTVYEYLKFKNAQGFKKQYKDGKFSFVAILTNEDVDIFEFMESTDSRIFLNAVKNPEKCAVITSTPKFKAKSSFSKELNGALISLGLRDVFNQSKADLTLMGESTGERNVFLSMVVHKTYLSLTQNGTRAGAASAAVVYDTCAPDPATIEINLTRPFLYAIVDNETGLPVFMGTVLSL